MISPLNDLRGENSPPSKSWQDKNKIDSLLLFLESYTARQYLYYLNGLGMMHSHRERLFKIKTESILSAFMESPRRLNFGGGIIIIFSTQLQGVLFFFKLITYKSRGIYSDFHSFLPHPP